MNYTLGPTKVYSNPRNVNIMSSNTKIYLNPHAKTEEVFKVIQKIMGADFTQSTSGGRKANKNLPCGENNPWFVKFKKVPENIIKLSDSQYFNFYFLDPIGNTQSSMYFFEGLNDDFYSSNNEKIMNPDSTALWGVLGKRLVDFFGGKVLFCDSADSDNPDNWHVCEDPKYPQKLQGESSNERYFRFYNSLFNEKLITSNELEEMKKVTRYWNEDDSQLLDYLKKYEEAKELSDSLHTNPEKGNAKKLKV
jgi:hypothetical protein